jgi:hypothetical protein
MKIDIKRKLTILLIAALILFIPAGVQISADGLGSWSIMDSGTTADLYGIWGSSNNNVFAAGRAGTILHYNGTSWSAAASGSTADLYGIWGSGSTDIYSVGQLGTILHYDGTSWSAAAGVAAVDWHGIWGSSSTDIFAVGKAGNILHYDGTAWSGVVSGTTVDLYGIWGSGSTDVFAVGKSGTILHYDGTSWSLMTSGTAVDLHGIWGSGSASIFAVGKAGNILLYDGTSWSLTPGGTTADLYGVWGADSSHVFAAGQSGVILNYDGANFSSMERNTASDLRSVWGTSYADVFIAGASGTVLWYSPPVIYSILPDEGAQGATLNVTINGTNFSGASAVQFGAGISVNSFTVVSSNRIDVNITITPGAATGDRNVTVTTAGGSYTLVDGFTVKQALPLITALAPNQGRQGETLNVTVTGTNLSGASALQFGAGITVNNFYILSASQITASISISAEAATGSRDVSVTTPGGSFTFSGGFTVKPPLPLITSVEPNEARQGETLSATITGVYFTGASAVQFGAGISVNEFTVIAAGQITASITVSAEAATGSRDVTVTTPGGSFIFTNGFTVKQAFPLITSVEPNQGRQGETLSLTISGAHFNGASAIQFGSGISINSFSVLSSNQISVNITIAPDAAAGGRGVSVATPGGSFTLSNGFTVKQAMPVITSISPSSGNRSSSSMVTIIGSNLEGVTAVSFGEGIEVIAISSINPTQLQVNLNISSDALTGLRDVSVTTAGGSFTLPGCFTVKQELPLITAISIDSANQGATLSLTITGANFTGASGVQFGPGISINSFNVLSSSQITVNITIASGAAAGTRDITVTTPGGSFVLPGSFTVIQALPGIKSVNPDSGNPGTTMVVIINGNNLTGTTSVSMGAGVEVTGFTNISPTQISVNINIKADAVIGYRDISITTPGGNTIFAQGFNIQLKSRNTAALIAIWTGIAVLFIILTVILHVLRRRRAARL